jgi:pteridine reductase
MTQTTPKLALVTGAGVRLGRAIALRLAQSGYDVVVHYNRSEKPAQQTAELVEEAGRTPFLIQADLSTEEGIRSLVDYVVSLQRGLDVLVNNASIFYPTSTPDEWVKEWDEFQMVNLKSPFLLTTGLLSALRERSGCVINIVDIWARFPLRRFLPYSVAKSGLEALTKCLALELAPEIRVNGVSPGAALPPPNSEDSMDKMLTQVPMKSYGGADSIAQAVDYLTRAEYVTGQILAVDGGRSINL